MLFTSKDNGGDNAPLPGGPTIDPPELVARFDNFLRWEPIPPKSAAELAKVSARLCRLLRDEVTEQLAEKSPALTALAADWRKLLNDHLETEGGPKVTDLTGNAREVEEKARQEKTDALKEFQVYLKDEKGLKDGASKHRLRGAKLFKEFLLGRKPAKYERVS